MFFKKSENAKCALGDHEESAHHGVSIMVWSVQLSTLEVSNDTPKVPNGTLQLPSGPQPLGPTLMQFHVI